MQSKDIELNISFMDNWKKLQAIHKPAKNTIFELNIQDWDLAQKVTGLNLNSLNPFISNNKHQIFIRNSKSFSVVNSTLIVDGVYQNDDICEKNIIDDLLEKNIKFISNSIYILNIEKHDMFSYKILYCYKVAKLEKLL